MRTPFSWLTQLVLNHLVLLGFLSFALVAYLWRVELFGVAAPVPPSDEPADPPGLVADPPAPMVPEALLPAASQPEAPAPGDPAPVESAPVEPAPVEPAPVEPAPVEPAPVEPVPEATLVPVSPKPGAVAPKAAPAPTAKPQQPPAEVLLQQARRAFWDGALEQAQQRYLSYLAQRPADANVFGELGNLYQSMGRPVDALDAYYEAGIRFRERGDREQLQQIVDLFREAGDRRAEQLQR